MDKASKWVIVTTMTKHAQVLHASRIKFPEGEGPRPPQQGRVAAAAERAAALARNPDAAADNSAPFRCWICLEDAQTSAGFISPCACVGSGEWVHEECLKLFVIKRLTEHQGIAVGDTVALPDAKRAFEPNLEPEEDEDGDEERD